MKERMCRQMSECCCCEMMAMTSTNDKGLKDDTYLLWRIILSKTIDSVYPSQIPVITKRAPLVYSRSRVTL